MYERILVPIDGGATAQRGLDEAIALAGRLGSTLHLLHVVDARLLIAGGLGVRAAEPVAGRLARRGREAAGRRGDTGAQPRRPGRQRAACDPGLRVCDLILNEAAVPASA